MLCHEQLLYKTNQIYQVGSLNANTHVKSNNYFSEDMKMSTDWEKNTLHRKMVIINDNTILASAVC